MNDLERISVTIERKLLSEFDTLIAQSGHQNRSEAVRDLIRNRLIEEEAERSASGFVMGTLTLVYDHTQRELPDRLVDAGHRHHHTTLSTLHVHLNELYCLEVIVMHGLATDVRHVAAHMLGIKGVKHGKLVLTSSEL